MLSNSKFSYLSSYLKIHFLNLFYRFFSDPGYKEYIENAVAFNRKLNEERKMRLPYIDGQTGVAQRHYNSARLKRERMPPTSFGKVLQYPQKHW